MNQELVNLISKFNAAQAKAVDILENKFNCPRPNSTDDYIVRCVPIIRNENYESHGYKIRPHGIGMEINIEGEIVDFDFGQNGEFNGFDAWRLMEFVNNNKINTSLNTEDKIESAINEALVSGEIIKGDGIGNIHYVNS